MTYLIVLAVVGYFGFELYRAFTTGIIRNTFGSPVDREGDPGMFWFTAALYAAVIIMAILYAFTL